MTRRCRLLVAFVFVAIPAAWLMGCHGGSDEAGLSATQPEVTPASGGVSTTDRALLGDMDDSSTPGVNDAIAILRIVVGIDSDSPVADANQNGSTDVGDAILVLRCVVGFDQWPIGELPGEAATVAGYVGAGVRTAQSGSGPALQLLGTAPTTPVPMARVRIVCGEETFDVRSLRDGYFAAEVTAGAVTVTAYPPENETDDHSASDPAQVTAAEGRITQVDGSDAGEAPEINPADYMIYNLGDKRATRLTSWEAESGDDQFHVSTDWLRLVIGTTVIAGEVALVSTDPRGAPDGVYSLQENGAIVVGNDSYIVKPHEDGTFSIYGMCTILRNDDGTYEAIGTMFDPIVTYPTWTLGSEYNTTITATRQALEIDLVAGFSLSDLYDPEEEPRTMDPMPTEPVPWIARLTGIGHPVTTPAGVFTDTITLTWTHEMTSEGRVNTQTSQEVYARGVGLVAMDSISVARNEGAAPDTAEVVGVSNDLLLYARINGAEYGTLPQ